MTEKSLIRQLLNDLRSDDKQKQHSALHHLTQIKDELNDPVNLPELLRALDQRNRHVRIFAVRLLGKIGESEAVMPLTERLVDRSKDVRQAAAQALGQIGDDTAVPALIGALLGDENSFVRWEAARALGSIDHPSAIPPLLEALEADENSYVRFAAAEALGQMGANMALEGLEHALLKDDNHYVRFAAAKALGQIADPSSVPTLLRALNTHNTHIWHAAAEALWVIDEDAMPYILTSLMSDDMTLRRAALKAILWLSVEFDDDDAALRDDMDWGGSWGWWN
jgi:HEAT repeat protein